ncbi:MAG: hypothetical protein ACE5G2_11045 [Candidatus Krumholzibacteriia bacterium]
MEDYHEIESRGQRAFMVTRYVFTAQGRMVPEMPAWCVRGSRGGCRLRIDHFRERKTGPCFPLAVIVCAMHRFAFTLYPPEHVPYGRVAVAPVDIAGAVIVERDEEGGERVAWELSLFRAAVDAAAGLAWQRGSRWADPRRWRTQGRHLTVGARLLGIAGEIGKRKREQMARLLGVALLVVSSAAETYRTAVGYQARGWAVVDVLTELNGHGPLGDRMLAAGAAVGLWGAPSRWDPGGGAFRPTLRALG